MADVDEIIKRLKRKRAALDAEITALSADDPQREELRAELRRVENKIDILAEESGEELTAKDRRMARAIAEEMTKIQKETTAALDDKAVDDKTVDDKTVDDKTVDDKTVDDKTVDDKGASDTDPAPEHPFFRDRSRKK